MIQVQAANVTVMVTDLSRSIDFYVDMLGFKLINRYGNHWADIEGPGIHLGLHPSEKKMIRSENMQIALRVDDLNSAIEFLNDHGITCTAKADGKVKLAPFTDPDGNLLYLVQPEW